MSSRLFCAIDPPKLHASSGSPKQVLAISPPGLILYLGWPFSLGH
jgi:hypothetical protein